MKIKNKFQELSVFIECSTGNTPTVASLKQYVDLISQFGYTQLYLGLTDAYKLEGEPYFNFCRGGYTIEQLQEIDQYAAGKGVELRANVQVLGHMAYMIRHDCYREMMDTSQVLMVGEERTYEFVEKIIATMSEGIKSRVLHIGMDEVWGLGTGRYRQKHGPADTQSLFFEHLSRVLEIAKKYNYSCEMWSDMFYRMVQGSDFDEDGVMPDNIKECIPEGVRTVHWCYHKQTDEVLRKQIIQNKTICDDMTFAGCAWKTMGLAPNNKFSMEVIEQQLHACEEAGVRNYMVTLWSDAGAHSSIFSVLPTLFATAQMATGKKLVDIDKELFAQIVGVRYDDFMLVDNLNNPFFKELHKINSRSYWGLMSDVFMGSYDLMLDEHSNEAYEKLAEIYEQVDAGDYRLMFNDYKLYSKVLSIKMNLGVQVRKAYREKNKVLLEQYATIEIPRMISYMEAYVENFERRWLSENMEFGLEVHHLFYGGQIERWKYIAKRLLQYVHEDVIIEAMEREELEASIIPLDGSEMNEDCCNEMNYRYLISQCGI